MHSVHFDIDGNNGLIFKSKDGFGKVKIAVVGTWKDHEMSKEDFDLLLGELEGLRERLYI